jgi:hypothetical protein
MNLRPLYERLWRLERAIQTRDVPRTDGLAIRAFLQIGDDPEAALEELREHYRRHPRRPGDPECLAQFLGLVD